MKIPLISSLLVLGIFAVLSTTTASTSGTRQTARVYGTTASDFGYLEYLPPGYTSTSNAPLIVFLHGAGEYGDGTSQLSIVARNGPPQLIRDNAWSDSRPFIVLSPQFGTYVSDGTGHSDIGILLHDFIAYAVSHYSVDPQRIYLTGLSAGSVYSWNYLERYADDPVNNQIAALIPVSDDGTDAWSVQGVKLNQTPIWEFHGGYDTAQPVWQRTHFLDTLIASSVAAPNLDVRRTVYPGLNHSDTWVHTYGVSDGHDIYTWMLSKRRLPVAPANSAGVIQFDLPSTMIRKTEGQSGLSNQAFTVIRLGGSAGAVNVSYTTVNGTATSANADYVPTSGTLHWDDGDSSPKTVSIPVQGDTVQEADETLTVVLSAPTGGATLGTSTAELTIADDDTPQGFLQFNSGLVSAPEGNTAWSQTFTVSRVGGSIGAVGVSYHTEIETARSDDGYVDYTAKSGKLAWADGDAADKTFTVSIIGDTVYEPDESFIVPLNAPTGGAKLGPDRTSIVEMTLLNDDAGTPGVLKFSNPTINTAEGNSGNTTKTFTVTRTGGTSGAVTVFYRPIGGTARPTADYVDVRGELSWNSGDGGSRSITVSIVGNTVDEPDKTLILGLISPGGGATLGTSRATLTILNDDGAVTPTPPAVAADDNANTLSASHSLGSSEIVVSQNSGPFVAYTGTIDAGNQAVAAGYWKFKIKAATGRLESAAIDSPAFTAGGVFSYDYWRATHFTPDELGNPSVSGSTADPDIDGLSNLIEFWLGSDPKIPDVEATPYAEIIDSDLTLTYRVDLAKTGISVLPEQSTDLTTWTGGVSTVVLSTSGTIETRRASISIPGTTPFIRLKVTQP